MNSRFLSRCFIIASIPLGLAAWLLLPPLFSLIIILSLAYLAACRSEALEADANRVQQSNEFQGNEYFGSVDNAPLNLPKPLPPAAKTIRRVPER